MSDFLFDHAFNRDEMLRVAKVVVPIVRSKLINDREKFEQYYQCDAEGVVQTFSEWSEFMWDNYNMGKVCSVPDDEYMEALPFLDLPIDPQSDEACTDIVRDYYTKTNNKTGLDLLESRRTWYEEKSISALHAFCKGIYCRKLIQKIQMGVENLDNADSELRLIYLQDLE